MTIVSNRLFRCATDGRIYYIFRGKKHWIQNPETLDALSGLDKRFIDAPAVRPVGQTTITDCADLTSYPSGPNLTNTDLIDGFYYKCGTSEAVYFIDGSRKRLISNMTTLRRLGMPVIITLNTIGCEKLSNLSSGAAINFEGSAEPEQLANASGMIPCAKEGEYCNFKSSIPVKVAYGSDSVDTLGVANWMKSGKFIGLQSKDYALCSNEGFKMDPAYSYEKFCYIPTGVERLEPTIGGPAKQNTPSTPGPDPNKPPPSDPSNPSKPPPSNPSNPSNPDTPNKPSDSDPFWKSWWFIGGMVLLVLMIIIIIIVVATSGSKKSGQMRPNNMKFNPRRMQLLI